MVRAHRIVYGLGLAQMWRLPELDEMVRSASGLSDADSAILLDEENVPTANSSRQQIGAYMRALGSLVSCLPDEHATAQSNGLLSLATIIDSVVFEALDTFEVLDPPVNNHREEFKHERRTQEEWARLAIGMVKERVAEITKLLSEAEQPPLDVGVHDADGRDDGAKKKRKKTHKKYGSSQLLLRTEKKSWKQLLPILYRMEEPARKGEPKHFDTPKCIRAFNNKLRKALDKCGVANFKVGSLNLLMNKYDRSRFASKKRDQAKLEEGSSSADE